MKKLTFLAIALLCLFNVAAVFESFNYLEPDRFKQILESGNPVIIADIQVENEFATHHFPGAMETNAFPVQTETERKKIDSVVTAYNNTGLDVVVVCPRGGGGAKRCYSYLKEQGIPEDKLTILKGGVEKWPYPEMLVSK